LFSYIFSVHATVLSASLFALYKFGENSATVKAINEAFEKTVSKLRLEIANQLRICLRPVFSKQESQIDINAILDDRGDPFHAEPESPEGTLAYKEALLDFVTEKKTALADYSALRQSRKGWLFWNQARSWVALASSTWEFVATSGIGICYKIANFDPGIELLNYTLIISAVIFLAFFITVTMAMFFHSRFMELSNSYE